MITLERSFAQSFDRSAALPHTVNWTSPLYSPPPERSAAVAIAQRIPSIEPLVKYFAPTAPGLTPKIIQFRSLAERMGFDPKTRAVDEVRRAVHRFFDDASIPTLIEILARGDIADMLPLMLRVFPEAAYGDAAQAAEDFGIKVDGVTVAIALDPETNIPIVTYSTSKDCPKPDHYGLPKIAYIGTPWPVSSKKGSICQFANSKRKHPERWSYFLIRHDLSLGAEMLVKKGIFIREIEDQLRHSRIDFFGYLPLSTRPSDRDNPHRHPGYYQYLAETGILDHDSVANTFLKGKIVMAPHTAHSITLYCPVVDYTLNPRDVLADVYRKPHLRVSDIQEHVEKGIPKALARKVVSAIISLA